MDMNGASPRASPSRRSSYSSINSYSHASARSLLGSMEDRTEEKPKPVVTAESIAAAHFAKELQLHTTEDDERPAETIVVLHDACYGHMYSRPKTRKADLERVVERPERIQASVLGVSAAYVRLGGRHEGGKHAIKPSGKTDKESIPFRIKKSERKLELSSPAVTNVHGVKWMEELKLMCNNAEAKLAHGKNEVGRPVMDRGNDVEAPSRFSESDMYLCSESLDAMEAAMGAVCDGVDAVFAERGPKRAFVVVRPPGHHCSSDYPSGFCWVNNVHVGISHATLQHGLTHAAIIDFDLHHGDGSQDIAWSHNERGTSLAKNSPAWRRTSIGYFSIHDINSYPCEWGDKKKVQMASLCIDNAHGQNIWNVHLGSYEKEDEFWDLYENRYSVLLEKTRIFLKRQTQKIIEAGRGVQPKAAIFLSAGFDASEHESDGMQRHKVHVPTEFYARLARDVRRIAEEEGTSVDGRVISVLEGGYSNRALCSGVFSHISGLAGSDPDTTPILHPQDETRGLGFEIPQRHGSLSVRSSHDGKRQPPPAYDPSWWALSHLEALDAERAPQPAAPIVAKPKEGPPATYYASTQSFDAKIAESPQARRSSSGLFKSLPGHGLHHRDRELHSAQSYKQVRAPTPPSPEVSWSVAAKELCKALVPQNCQVNSCTPEALGAAATRQRKDRASLLVTPPETPLMLSPEPTIRKSTRTRKPVQTGDVRAEEEVPVSAAARASRRRTVAGAAVIAMEPPALPTRGASSRAVSTTSMIASSIRSGARRSSMTSSSDSNMRGMGAMSLDGARSSPPLPGLKISSRPSTSASVRPESNVRARAAVTGGRGRGSTTTAGSVSRAGLTSTSSREVTGRTPSANPFTIVADVGPSSARLSSTTTFGTTNDQIRTKVAPNTSDSTKATSVDKDNETKAEDNSVKKEHVMNRESSVDMDSLTSAVKKIKITLLTKEQREAKNAALAAAAAAAVDDDTHTR